MVTTTKEKPFLLTESVHFDSPSWLRDLQRAARKRYELLNFPTTKEEEWRFTNLTPFLSDPYNAAISPVASHISLEELNQRLPGLSQSLRIVFLNGKYSPELSGGIPTGENVVVSPLSEAFASTPAIQNHFGKYALYDDNIFTALNTAAFREGVAILVSKGVTLNRPVHVVFISNGLTGGAHFPRTFVHAGEGSSVSVVESYLGASGKRYWTGAVSEILLEPSAVLEHCRLESEGDGAIHVGLTEVCMGRDSSYRSFSISLGAQLARNDLNVVLDDAGADASLYGLYLASGSQLVDHHTTMDHVKPHGTSRELYKGILTGNSRAVFNGKIIVRKDAQKTDAIQTNKNLLISDGARVNTKPQLEILADDVKCKHGATIGHMEEDALFYLRSRGISEERARILLMHGFVFDVLEQIRSEEAKSLLEGLLRARLQEFAAVVEEE